ncbi:YihY/virulence factor BrkB family protein [soil metagenome]
MPTQRSGQPGPDSPLDLEPTDWKATLKRTLKEIKDDRVTLAAAGMAYYLFLSIFPALIAFVGILGLLDADTGPIAEAVRNAPGEAGVPLAEAIEAAGERGGSLVAVIVGIAVALWSASAGFVALQSGLNIAYDVPQDRKFIGKRAVALLLVVATGLLGGVPSPIFTFGESLVFVVLGWVLTIVALVVLFSLYYYFGPNRESPSWQWVSLGGVVGALLWILASAGFGLYVATLGEAGYARTYGALAGVIILVLWLYLSSLAILIGGELNAEIERQGGKRTQEPPTA